MMQTAGSIEGLREGQEIPPLEMTVERQTLVRYAGASDDYAYQHWDHPRMTAQGFPDVVVHGWLTFAYMCQAVTNWIPQELAEISTYAVRYRRPTFPGLVRCGGRVARSQVEEGVIFIDLELWAKDADGEVTTTAVMTLRQAG